MTLSNFMLEAAMVFLPILATLASFFIAFLIEWIKTKTKNKKLKDYLNELGAIIIAVVHDIQQTFVENMKDPLLPGEWSDEQAKIALQMALDKVKTQLPAYMLFYLKNIYTDLDAFIRTKIESQLYEDKKYLVAPLALELIEDE